MKVLVGMSGGVDSSVAAILLKEQGYEVIGATMSHWGTSEIFKRLSTKIPKTSTHCACITPNEKENIEQTKQIAEKIGVKLHVIDCAKEYEETVLNYFKSEYMEGRTPNPCVKCNRYIKFGIFPELVKKAGIDFDKFATGHYAKIVNEGEKYLLKRGVNPKKDQSYFLYGLSQEQLATTLLPIGDYTKEEIREIAKKHGLEVANKPDSQDFYNGDYNDILNMQPKIGNIVDLNGKILGKHQGFWNYTIGQRKGIGVAAEAPLYVTELRKDTNEVVVSFKEDSLNKGLIASNINLISVNDINEPIKCSVKYRSAQEPKEAVIKKIDNDRIEVIFDELQNPIATGQSAVFYDKETVIGGGIIEGVL